jgi:glyoxylase-like metal-dependent hydrolase (beta-lactamase superfamily II)
VTADGAATAPTTGRPGSTPAGPIRSVSVVSTGTVRIHPQQPNGSSLPLFAWLVGSRSWTPPLPVNAYVIDHADGLVLFDTGQDRSSVTNPRYFPGGVKGFLYGRLARFEIAPDETLVARLAALGHRASDVRLAILSHLHQDHIGGIRYLPDAEFIVADDEWRAMERPRSDVEGFLRSHIDLPGIRYRRIGFTPTDDPALAPFTSAHDIMGDGSLVLLPVPGHTPGSMALLVRRPGKAPLLMVGDLTYGAELLEAGRIPGVGDAAGLRASSDLVRRLADLHPDLVVLPAHDPGAAERLRRANSVGDRAPGSRR